MQEAPTSIREQVEAYAEKTNENPEDVLNAVEEQFGQTPDSYPDERRWKFAYRTALKNFTSSRSLSGSGDEATVISIGHGPVMPWIDRDHEDYEEGMDREEAPRKDVLVCNGVIRDERDGSASLGVILFDETNDVDIGHAMEMFRDPFNVVEGRFSFSEPQTASEGTVLFTTNGTELREVEDPPTMEERQKWIHNFVDEVQIADIASAPMANLSLADDRGAADFGLDIKRIPDAWLIDYHVFDNGNGVYTVLDDSIVDAESELEGTPLIGESQQVAGLTCWTEGDMIQYDEGSTCDVYGVVQEGNDGQITMNVRGIDPIFADPLHEEEADNQMGEGF